MLCKETTVVPSVNVSALDVAICMKLVMEVSSCSVHVSVWCSFSALRCLFASL